MIETSLTMSLVSLTSSLRGLTSVLREVSRKMFQIFQRFVNPSLQWDPHNYGGLVETSIPSSELFLPRLESCFSWVISFSYSQRFSKHGKSSLHFAHSIGSLSVACEIVWRKKRRLPVFRNLLKNKLQKYQTTIACSSSSVQTEPIQPMVMSIHIYCFFLFLASFGMQLIVRGITTTSFSASFYGIGMPLAHSV